MNHEIIKMAARVGLIRWGTLFLLIFLFGLFGIIVPVRTQLGRINEEKKTMTARIAATEESVKELENFDTVYTLKKEEIRKLQDKTLKRGEHAKVISLLTEITQQLNISILNIKLIPQDKVTPEEEEERKMVPASFHLEMMSRYQAIGHFLENLEEAPLILTVKHFETKPDPINSGFLITRFQLTAYEEKGV